jgi:hypothetical protein
MHAFAAESALTFSRNGESDGDLQFPRGRQRPSDARRTT